MNFSQAVENLQNRDPSNVIMFIGSGFSQDLGFPNWPELLERCASLASDYYPPLATIILDRLNKKDLICAADPFFAKEIPVEARVKFLKNIFDPPSRPNLNRRHKLLGNLRVAAFVTTNYDFVVEWAIQSGNRFVTSFTGSERMKRFNSELPMYKDSFLERVDSKALVLKLHNDTSDAENLVLSSRQFEELPQMNGYNAFFQTAIRGHNIVFIGFGGSDPNLLDQLIANIGEFAGYGLSTSFLFLPQGNASPVLPTSSPIETVYYSPNNNHAELDELLKAVNDSWRKFPERKTREFQTPGIHQDLISLSDLPTGPEANTLSLFDIIVPAAKRDFDRRAFDIVGSEMVINARRASLPATDKKSAVNQLSQKYRISPSKARQIVEHYWRESEIISPREAFQIKSGLDVLAEGLRERCIAYDPDWRFNLDFMRYLVKNLVEYSLQITGCSLALAILGTERPSRMELSQVVRAICKKAPIKGIGNADREALDLALPDLFLRPTDEEEKVLSRLAMTATSLGLLLALPDPSSKMDIIPKIVYLDTTCVLPLLTKTMPRYSAYQPFVELSNTMGIEIRFLSVFLGEVQHHWRVAEAIVKNEGIKTVKELEDYLEGSMEEYENVFLLAILQSNLSSDESVPNALKSLFPIQNGDYLKTQIESLGISVVKAPAVDPDDLISIQTEIQHSKKYWWERSNDARRALARNEAWQLLVLKGEKRSGVLSWFATSDGQLRRVVRQHDWEGGERTLAIGGAISIVEALANGRELISSFSRILWAPDITDQIDQVLGKQLKKMIGEATKKGEQLPIERARILARENYTRTIDERSARAEDNYEIDTSIPIHKRISESVYQAIGKAFEESRAKRK